MEQIQYLGYGLAAILMVTGMVISYRRVKKAKDQGLLEKKTSYKIDKTKGYDYNNPKRFFCEPLMRYVMIPMASCFAALIPLLIPAAIMNDGGLYLFTNFPWTNWYVGIFLGGAFFLLIAYTILYAVRGWGNKEQWRMEYA